MTIPGSKPAALGEQKSSEAGPEVLSNGGAALNSANETAADEHIYNPVPRTKSVTISVRYHTRGRGLPLPYPLADECDE